MILGIIGGSGLYEIGGLTNLSHRRVDTPFGAASDDFACAEYNGQALVFLPRHGRGHGIMPSEINHRANIYGFKALGVDTVISISAVGSLKETLRPRDVVLPDQYYDRTKASRGHTFFGDGIVAHVSMAEPTCAALRARIAAVARETVAARGVEVQVHASGTYVNMEGPAFSTKAESRVYRSFGFDVIGMTGLGEARLCREAQICYQAVALVTDYDCWHASEAPVSVEMVVAHLKANTALAMALIKALAGRIDADRACACRTALAGAILTDPAAICPAARRRLGPILDGVSI